MTLKIGCTGGIACGKSEAADRIRMRGIPVLDTDQVAHQVLRPGNEAFDRMVERFGVGVLDASGELNRSALGSIVFSDPNARQDLNRIVHPEVGRRWRAWLSAQTAPAAVVVIPLLVEVGCQQDFDHILCISSSLSLMRERLEGRGLTPEQAEQRIQSQLPLEKKEQHATWILRNEGSLTEFHRQVDEWISTHLTMENT